MGPRRASLTLHQSVTKHRRPSAQMAELVDALVSGTSAARRGGSSPLLGTSFLDIKFCHSSTAVAPRRSPGCGTLRAFGSCSLVGSGDVAMSAGQDTRPKKKAR